MENFPTWTAVVAAALSRNDGLWLMHKRPEHKQHGGLWEFPGGKVETGETPVNALVREISEELGIAISAKNCVAAGLADSTYNPLEPPIVILLYTVVSWSGHPIALEEGGKIGWFTPAEIAELAKPPLDVALARQLFRNCGA